MRTGNIHLTLKFLGEIDHGQIRQIKEQMTEAVAGSSPIRLTLDQVGVFPNTKRPRVLWAGLNNEEGALSALQQNIETELAEAGFPRDKKPFVPHLTLARIKSPKARQALIKELDALNAEGIDPNPFQAVAVHLYQSQLTPKGSIYTVLAKFELN